MAHTTTAETIVCDGCGTTRGTLWHGDHALCLECAKDNRCECERCAVTIMAAPVAAAPFEPTVGAVIRMSGYQRMIAELIRDTDPRWIEAWMRLEHPTLDHLDRVSFAIEAYEALACVLASTDTENEALAASFGL